MCLSSTVRTATSAVASDMASGSTMPAAAASSSQRCTCTRGSAARSSTSMACYESRMRAALLESPGQELLVADDIDIDPDPRAGEVLVRMSHCGVCHSDLHFVNGSLPCPLPVVL